MKFDKTVSKWRQQTAPRFVVFVGALRERACIKARSRQPPSISRSSICCSYTPAIKHLPTFPPTPTLSLSLTGLSSVFILSIPTLISRSHSLFPSPYSPSRSPFSPLLSNKERQERRKEKNLFSLHCWGRSLPHFMDLQSRRAALS